MAFPFNFLRSLSERPAEALASGAADAQLRSQGQIPEEIRPDAKTEAFLVRRMIERQKRAAAAKAAAEAEAKRLEELRAFAQEELRRKRNRKAEADVAEQYMTAGKAGSALNAKFENYGLPWRIREDTNSNQMRDSEESRVMPRLGFRRRLRYPTEAGPEDVAARDAMELRRVPFNAFVSRNPGGINDDQPTFFEPDPSMWNTHKVSANPFYLDSNAAPDRFKEVAPARLRAAAQNFRRRLGL